MLSIHIIAAGAELAMMLLSPLIWCRCTQEKCVRFWGFRC